MSDADVVPEVVSDVPKLASRPKSIKANDNTESEAKKPSSHDMISLREMYKRIQAARMTCCNLTFSSAETALLKLVFKVCRAKKPLVVDGEPVDEKELQLKLEPIYLSTRHHEFVFHMSCAIKFYLDNKWFVMSETDINTLHLALLDPSRMFPLVITDLYYFFAWPLEQSTGLYEAFQKRKPEGNETRIMRYYQLIPDEYRLKSEYSRTIPFNLYLREQWQNNRTYLETLAPLNRPDEILGKLGKIWKSDEALRSKWTKKAEEFNAVHEPGLKKNEETRKIAKVQLGEVVDRFTASVPISLSRPLAEKEQKKPKKDEGEKKKTRKKKPHAEKEDEEDILEDAEDAPEEDAVEADPETPKKKRVFKKKPAALDEEGSALKKKRKAKPKPEATEQVPASPSSPKPLKKKRVPKKVLKSSDDEEEDQQVIEEKVTKKVVEEKVTKKASEEKVDGSSPVKLKKKRRKRPKNDSESEEEKPKKAKRTKKTKKVSPPPSEEDNEEESEREPVAKKKVSTNNGNLSPELAKIMETSSESDL